MKWKEYLRKARVIFLENVKNLVDHDKGEALKFKFEDELEY